MGSLRSAAYEKARYRRLFERGGGEGGVADSVTAGRPEQGLGTGARRDGQQLLELLDVPRLFLQLSELAR